MDLENSRVLSLVCVRLTAIGHRLLVGVPPWLTSAGVVFSAQPLPGIGKRRCKVVIDAIHSHAERSLILQVLVRVQNLDLFPLVAATWQKTRQCEQMPQRYSLKKRGPGSRGTVT